MPKRIGDYIPVYRPKKDRYLGKDTEHFHYGEQYDWICNDFSVLRDKNSWHIVGITHPKPPSFESAFHYDEDSIHEAEFQLFHCTAKAEDFSRLMHPDSFTEGKKLLYPAERPGERDELWAPHLMKRGNTYAIVYSPQQMRLASTKDFVSFETGTVLFHCKNPGARDPQILDENGVFYMVYCDEEGILCRVSRDFKSWSDPEILLDCPYANAAFESPFLMKRCGYYYLFVCIYDGRNSAYDQRTMVFAADSLSGIRHTAPLTMLDAHAPEIVSDVSGDYLLSVYYPENGVSAARIVFE